MKIRLLPAFALLILLSLACSLPAITGSQGSQPPGERVEAQTALPSQTARSMDVEPTTAFKESTAVWVPLASATPAPQTTTQGDAFIYTDPAGAFHIQVPAGWTVTQDDQKRTTSFCKDAKDAFSCLNLRHDAVQGKDLAAYAGQVLDDLKTHVEEFIQVDASETTIAGQPGLQYGLSYTLDGAPLKGTLAFVVKDGQGYYFNCMERSASFPTLTDIYFQRMVHTFEFGAP